MTTNEFKKAILDLEVNRPHKADFSLEIGGKFLKVEKNVINHYNIYEVDYSDIRYPVTQQVGGNNTFVDVVSDYIYEKFSPEEIAAAKLNKA